MKWQWLWPPSSATINPLHICSFLFSFLLKLSFLFWHASHGLLDQFVFLVISTLAFHASDINPSTLCRKLTLKPHLGGTPADEVAEVDMVYQTWKEQGIDYVTTMTYDVLLSYPNKAKPNLIQILDATGTPKYTTSIREEILVPEMEGKDISQPWAAFSPPGTVEV